MRGLCALCSPSVLSNPFVDDEERERGVGRKGDENERERGVWVWVGGVASRCERKGLVGWMRDLSRLTISARAPAYAGRQAGMIVGDGVGGVSMGEIKIT